MKKIILFCFTLAAAFAMSLTVSAWEGGGWDKEAILEYAEYCKTHSYKQQIGMYYEMFQGDDGGGSTYFYEEEDFLRIKRGENALIVINYELWDDLHYFVGEPEYNLSFSFYLNDGEEAGSDHYHVIDRNVFTVKELLRHDKIEEQTGKIIFAGIDAVDQYLSGYVFKGYDFIPCESGWYEIHGARYYVKKDGTLATSSLTIDGIRYKFDESGICQGKYTGFTKSTKSGNAMRYWKNGELLKNKWIKVTGVRKYYSGADGYFVVLMPSEDDPNPTI